VLDNVKLQHDFGIALPSWQEGLASVMAQIPIT
jgi:dTDP-4-dehydrorhamnose reductase